MTLIWLNPYLENQKSDTATGYFNLILWIDRRKVFVWYCIETCYTSTAEYLWIYDVVTSRIATRAMY